MADLDYLAASGFRRFRMRLSRGIQALPATLLAVGAAIPRRVGGVFSALGRFVLSLGVMVRRGDWATRLSFLVMGLGCLVRRRIGRGIVYLLAQAAFWYFFFTFGLPHMAALGALGETVAGETYNEATGIYEYTAGDNSMLLLLYGVVSIMVTVLYLILWYQSVRTSYRSQRMVEEGERVPTFREEIQDLSEDGFHRLLLFLPSAAVLIFTVLPLIFMILIAFTNYDRFHMPPGNLFTWVGLENFRAVLSLGENALLATTFRSILGWTLVWALIATLSNYILGMLLALLIGRRGVPCKKLFRAVFVTTVAIPQFVSLMFMRNLLSDTGLINVLFTQLGWISTPIPFLTDPTAARITVLVVNMWVGIPYSMLITTGILLNIPKDLYEACRIDGASPIRQFTAITLPYVLYVTGPYLITQFVGNINNFNVIWLLSGGGPMTGDYYQAGRTDLLITWLYRITTGEQNYKLASVIGILTFVISAVFSLIVYSRTSDGEGDFG